MGYDVKVYEGNVSGEYSSALTVILFDQKNKTLLRKL
jgi:hypothetical protein